MEFLEQQLSNAAKTVHDQATTIKAPCDAVGGAIAKQAAKVAKESRKLMQLIGDHLAGQGGDWTKLHADGPLPKNLKAGEVKGDHDAGEAAARIAALLAG